MADYQDFLTAGAFLVTAVLTILSLTAYLSTRERRLLIITAAFTVWSVRLGITATAALFIPSWEDISWVETTNSLLDAAAPLLIFYAMVRRDRPASPD